MKEKVDSKQKEMCQLRENVDYFSYTLKKKD